MEDAADIEFEHVPESDQSFENALAKARDSIRLSAADAVELFTIGTVTDGIDPDRKELVLEAADRRRAAVVGDEVSSVANLNNNVTTACNTVSGHGDDKSPIRSPLDGLATEIRMGRREVP